MTSRPIVGPVLVVTVIAAALGACVESRHHDATEVSQTAESTPAADAPVPVEPTSTTATTGTAPEPRTEREAALDVGTRDGDVVDPHRDRTVSYRVFAPVDTAVVAPVAVISHGGFGSERGYTTGNHVGQALAAHGFVAIHVGHRESAAPGRQHSDRPADVSFLLDLLAGGALDLPERFDGVVDLTRVGHLGHSFGAYTAHALAGAVFHHGRGPVTYTDSRVDAIVALSPQGLGQFGAFAGDDSVTTWSSVEVPVLGVAGSEELDGDARGRFRDAGWRLQPFHSYPGTADTFMIVVDGADHSDLWRTGGPELEGWLAAQVVAFFEVYVAGSDAVDACVIGSVGDLDRRVTVERRPGSHDSSLDGCR